MSQIISNYPVNGQIFAGCNNLWSSITFNVEPQHNEPTTFVIHYDNGFAPTGNNISVYLLGSNSIRLPILGLPIIDYINKTITIQISGGILKDDYGDFSIEFELVQI